MALIDDVRALSITLKIVPASAIIKVVRVFVAPAVDHWAAEVNRLHVVRCQHDTTSNSSPEYEAANKAYNSAFDNYHRLKFLMGKLDDVAAFRTVGQGPAEVSPKKPESVSEAAVSA